MFAIERFSGVYKALAQTARILPTDERTLVQEPPRWVSYDEYESSTLLKAAQLEPFTCHHINEAFFTSERQDGHPPRRYCHRDDRSSDLWGGIVNASTALLLLKHAKLLQSLESSVERWFREAHSSDARARFTSTGVFRLIDTALLTIDVWDRWCPDGVFLALALALVSDDRRRAAQAALAVTRLLQVQCHADRCRPFLLPALLDAAESPELILRRRAALAAGYLFPTDIPPSVTAQLREMASSEGGWCAYCAATALASGSEDDLDFSMSVFRRIAEADEDEKVRAMASILVAVDGHPSGAAAENLSAAMNKGIFDHPLVASVAAIGIIVQKHERAPQVAPLLAKHAGVKVFGATVGEFIGFRDFYRAAFKNLSQAETDAAFTITHAAHLRPTRTHDALSALLADQNVERRLRAECEKTARGAGISDAATLDELLAEVLYGLMRRIQRGGLSRLTVLDRPRAAIRYFLNAVTWETQSAIRKERRPRPIEFSQLANGEDNAIWTEAHLLDASALSPDRQVFVRDSYHDVWHYFGSLRMSEVRIEILRETLRLRFDDPSLQWPQIVELLLKHPAYREYFATVGGNAVDHLRTQFNKHAAQSARHLTQLVSPRSRASS